MSDDYEPHRAKELRQLSVVYPQVASTLCDAAEELESRARYFAQMQGSITKLALENKSLTARVAELEAENAKLTTALTEYACTGSETPCGCESLLTKDLLRAESAERERDELRRENERLRAALEFYADPYGRRDESGELIPVPDFYSELAFGAVAEKALGK
jgi:cell shape-determining protein MreC